MNHDHKLNIPLTRSGSCDYRDTADVDMLTSSGDLHREEYQHEGQHTADNVDMLTGSRDLHWEEYQHDGEQCCHGAGTGVDCEPSSWSPGYLGTLQSGVR